MGRTITGQTRRYLLAGALCAAPLMVQADVTNVTVKVTIVAAACTVNDNQAIEVNFGDVATNRVDGTNYRKPVSYTLSCSEGASKAMKLQVQGTGSAFDGSLLGTDVSGLGIRMQNGSSNLPLNQWVNGSATIPTATAPTARTTSGRVITHGSCGWAPSGIRTSPQNVR